MSRGLDEVKRLTRLYCAKMGVPESVFNTDDDKGQAVAGRWFIWWLLRRKGITLVDIASATSGGGHAPVFYACDRVALWHEKCPPLRDYLEAIADPERKPDPNTRPEHLLALARGAVGAQFKPGDLCFYLDSTLQARQGVVQRVFRRKDKYTLVMANGDLVLEESACAAGFIIRMAIEKAIEAFREMDNALPGR